MTTLRPSRPTSGATRSERAGMSSRREIIQFLGAGLMVTPSLALASEPSPRTSRAVERILVDERFPESEAFAGVAPSVRGAAVLRFRGDLTEIWMHDLDGLWKARPAAIAGVTGRDALFVLEQLARGPGLRVVSGVPAGPRSAAIAWLIA